MKIEGEHQNEKGRQTGGQDGCYPAPRAVPQRERGGTSHQEAEQERDGGLISRKVWTPCSPL